MHREKLNEKLKEALAAVLPIMGIVLVLSFTICPLSTDALLTFIFAGALLILGMVLFSMGADMSMQPIGELMGAKLTHTRKLWLIIGACFLLGFFVTVAEPDLQVLANQVSSIPNAVLIFSVAGGVGVFLVVAFLRMLLGIRLKHILFVAYALVFILAFFVPKSFIAIAFDSGGVTTGPMTVPFIMSFGVGIAAIRNDKHAVDDSFGLVAVCSVGPIIAVELLALIYSPESMEYVPSSVPTFDYSADLLRLFTENAPKYIGEMALALLPVLVAFLVFQVTLLHVEKRTLLRIGIGLVYIYVGLVIFLTAVNVGFMPVGTVIGATLGALPYKWILIPIGMLIGAFIVLAEPAVYVLMAQVEELTDGAITGNSLKISLSLGVAVSIGLAMVRIICDISILWFVVPGYAIAVVLSFFVPKMFTAIAFDSGGVASGPMTATFLMPFSAGACLAVGGDVMTQAFGVVAMVAMTPLITIQLLGLVYKLKSAFVVPEQLEPAWAAEYDNDAIIEL